MKGIKVETIALAKSGAEYRAVGEQLGGCAGRLRAVQKTLRTQTIGEEVREMLSTATRMADDIAIEAQELGAQCEEIAEVYNRTESRVSSLVAELSLATAMFSSSNMQGALASEVSTQTSTRVDSPYRPTNPALLCGNHLPCESWLLDRALKANMG